MSKFQEYLEMIYNEGTAGFVAKKVDGKLFGYIYHHDADKHLNQFNKESLKNLKGNKLPKSILKNIRFDFGKVYDVDSDEIIEYKFGEEVKED